MRICFPTSGLQHLAELYDVRDKELPVYSSPTVHIFVEINDLIKPLILNEIQRYVG